MKYLSALGVAVDALLVNKGRSLLTTLGIIIGVSTVIAAVSAGDGARLKLDERLGSVGKNLILVRAGARTSSGALVETQPLTRGDAEAIKRYAGALVTGVAESQTTQRQVASSTSHWDTAVVGSVPDLQRVRHWKVIHGRFYTDEDVRQAALVCLLGSTARRRLFPNHPNPVGDWLQVAGLRLRVIGVLGEKGRSPTGADQDDQVMVPITTLQRRIVRVERIYLILAEAGSAHTINPAKDAIIQALRRRHHLRPGDPNDFDVSSVREMAELAEFMTVTMQALVGVIAAISLVVGGIGIMNIMLVSVTERTHEIGIRLAVGARSVDILAQFLVEAIMLALAGGLLGLVVGLLAALGLARVADWPLVVSPALVTWTVLLSAGVGVLFGSYPAWKASRLDPIEALRNE